MKVAIFTDHHFGKVNGVTTTLTAALDCAPSSVHLRVYTAAAQTLETGDYVALRGVAIPSPRFGSTDMFVPCLGAYVERARADRIDVVHLTTPGPMGLAAILTAWRLRLPLIGSFHSDLGAPASIRSGAAAGGALMRLYVRWVYGKCARVLVQSEATRCLLVHAGTAPEAIGVWRPGVDTSMFSPEKRSSERRRLWRASDSRLALLHAGRVSEDDVHLLPMIQARLCELGIPHRFIIVGQGPMHEDLRRHMPDAVFTGALSREEAGEIFASADVFVLPSRSDTAANLALEAQACGLPVVVSDAGGPRENMIDGTTGLVVAGNDARRWADTVARVLRGPRALMSAAACEFASGRNWEQALEPLYRAYREVAWPDGRDSIGIDHRVLPRPSFRRSKHD
jgi:glycosyltransferase involved in cell wall biosynthesis